MSSESDSEVEMYSSNDGSDNENSNEIEYKKFEMPNLSGIKNKERRKALHLKYKKMQAEFKKKERKRRNQLRKELGDKAPPKPEPNTIDKTREPNETTVEADDVEVTLDQKGDEFKPYFEDGVIPKILIVPSIFRVTKKTLDFCVELGRVFPCCKVIYRKIRSLKKIIELAKEKGFTCLIVVNQNRGRPDALIMSHLPDGPTAHFKLTSITMHRDIKNVGFSTSHDPEIILNNFTTRIGHQLARMFASMFPHRPEFTGRRVVTIHNQRDYIFIRHHRYQFRHNKKCGLHELGPRFTLKLRTLQKGTFDSKFGDFEFMFRRRRMETSRRKFQN